ncbi:MAG: redoxin domain-containing protein [Syntrophales bacterium LBB04]|nr:redoxin domain-containing protein [Syntrophales bacterium LBB04]
MKKDKKEIATILISLVMLFLCGCASQGANTAGVSGTSVKPASDKNLIFPVFELPIPQSESEKSYLGISGTGNFRVGQTKTHVLIVEVFNFYCPHCQRVAPRVNELYQGIQGRPDLKEKIKMIGIGMGNSLYEVNLFREKYQVPFPLFSVQRMSISKMLGVEATPTFIGAKVNDKGSQEQFYFKAGEFPDAPQFLAEIIKSSRLE